MDVWRKAINAAQKLQAANSTKDKKRQKENHDALMLCLLAILKDHKKDA